MDLREALRAAEGSSPKFEKLGRAAALVLATLFVSPALAQRAATPTSVLEQCAKHLDSCRAECRARIFAVDPRREVCLKDCGETEVSCSQAADPRAQPSSESQPITMRRGR
jgi:hypothetical protein